MALPNASDKQWLAIARCGSLGFAMVLAGIPWRQHSRRGQLRNIGWNAPLIAACFGLLMLPACGGGGNTGISDPGTKTGSYTITVNTTSSSYTSSITVPATVQ
jgi:hypothetical protein